MDQHLLRKITRVIATAQSMQNPTGGFGGGHGQYSHLAGSYACLLSIALVGGHDTYSLVHRKKMWDGWDVSSKAMVDFKCARVGRRTSEGPIVHW